MTRAEPTNLSPFERMRFFRDLIQDQREELFRQCGISEAMLREVNGIHSHERRVLAMIERDGKTEIVRAKLEQLP